jgi:hypothetical protein
MTEMKDENNTELKIREIYNWIDDNSTYIETDSSGNTTSKIDDIFHGYIVALIRIEELVAEILATDEPAFVMQERLFERNDIKIIKKRLLELALARHFKSVIKLFERYTAYYKSSANVELFFDCCFKLELNKEHFNNPQANTSRQGKLAYELFNDLINLIRIKSREAEFRGVINDRENRANRNYKSAAEFVTGLFVRRLLVLRVDFAYIPKYANTISAEVAKADLAHFIYNFRHNKKLSEHLEGYLWKWEFTPLKKMHCHLLFFYNGAYVRNDAYWGNLIGEYWRDVITQGRGMYYNGNTKENKDKFEKLGILGIGMIDPIHDDPEKDTGKAKRDILINKIVKYILKSSQYLIATKLENSKGRIFGKGYGPN